MKVFLMRDVFFFFFGGGDKLLPSEKSPGLQLTMGVSQWPFLIYIRLLMTVSYTAHTHTRTHTQKKKPIIILCIVFCLFLFCECQTAGAYIQMKKRVRYTSFHIA